MINNTSDGRFIFNQHNCVCGFDRQNNKSDNCFADICQIIDRLCVGFKPEELDMAIKYFTNESSHYSLRVLVNISTDGKDQRFVLYYYNTTNHLVAPVFTIIINDITARKWFDWSKAKFRRFPIGVGGFTTSTEDTHKESELTLDDIRRFNVEKFNAENKKKSEHSKKSYNFGTNEIRKICDYFGSSCDQVIHTERLKGIPLLCEKILFTSYDELNDIFSVDFNTLFEDAYRTKCYVCYPDIRLSWTAISFPNEDKFVIRKVVSYEELATCHHDDIYICSYDEDAKPIRILHDSKQ